MTSPCPAPKQASSLVPSPPVQSTSSQTEGLRRLTHGGEGHQEQLFKGPPEMKCPRCGKDVTDGFSECPHCGVVFAKLRASGSPPHSLEPRPPRGTAVVDRKPSPPLFSKPFLVTLAILAVVAGLVAWYYFYGPCGTKAIDGSMRDLQQVAERWDDANAVAQSAPRVALSVPVSNLQAIKRDAQGLEVPRCLNPSKAALLSSMEASIAAYLAFMQDEDEAVVSSKMAQANSDLLTFRSHLGMVRDCAPFCIEIED